MKTKCDKCGGELEKPRIINVKWAVCRKCQDDGARIRNARYKKQKLMEATTVALLQQKITQMLEPKAKVLPEPALVEPEEPEINPAE